MRPLKTENREWGFFGTRKLAHESCHPSYPSPYYSTWAPSAEARAEIEEDVERDWEDISAWILEDLRDDVTAFSVREFLDSSHGRHLADRIADVEYVRFGESMPGRRMLRLGKWFRASAAGKELIRYVQRAHRNWEQQQL